MSLSLKNSILAKKIGEGILKILMPCGSYICERETLWCWRAKKKKTRDDEKQDKQKTHSRLCNPCDPCKVRYRGCCQGQHSEGWEENYRVNHRLEWARGKQRQKVHKLEQPQREIVYLILIGKAVKLLQFTELPLAGYKVTFRPVTLFWFEFARYIIEIYPVEDYYYYPRWLIAWCLIISCRMQREKHTQRVNKKEELIKILNLKFIFLSSPHIIQAFRIFQIFFKTVSNSTTTSTWKLRGQYGLLISGYNWQVLNTI